MRKERTSTRAHSKKPLYRKVNTKARGVHHNFGGDYKNSRHKELQAGMKRGIKRGLDYTPLFRFLLSKVGANWDEIHSEAVSRLDTEQPIYWMVAKNKSEAKAYILIGENSYFSGLYIDENKNLQIASPETTEETLEPSCPCCTHTFNGIPFTRKYDPQ